MQPQTIRLPHSGLQVPHTGYTVTSYKGHNTHDGIAYTATLRLNGKIIGNIENKGHGGPDTFYPTNSPTPAAHWDTINALEAFATHCIDSRGEPTSLEYVLGDLVTEYELTRDIRRAAKNGDSLLRMKDDYGADGWPIMVLTTEAPDEFVADRDRLRAYLLGSPKLKPSPTAWWQLWDPTAGRWVDVTDRPAHLHTCERCHARPISDSDSGLCATCTANNDDRVTL